MCQALELSRLKATVYLQPLKHPCKVSPPSRPPPLADNLLERRQMLEEFSLDLCNSTRPSAPNTIPPIF